VPVYCASRTVSVALRAERFGHRLHGHDVEVTVCVNSRRIINLDDILDALDAVLERVDHTPLWDHVPGDPILEDLACIALRGVSEILGVDMGRMSVELRIPRAKIIVFGGEGYCREEGRGGESQRA